MASAGLDAVAGAPLRVLIVDDSPDDAELVMIELREHGIAAEFRREYREDRLRALLDGFVPQLVLCDVNLPGFSGRAAHALLRERAPDARFVFLTGALDPRQPLPPADAVVLKHELAKLPALVRTLLPG